MSMGRYRHQGSSRASQTSAGSKYLRPHTSAEIAAVMKLESVLNKTDTSSRSPDRHKVPHVLKNRRGRKVPSQALSYDISRGSWVAASTSRRPAPESTSGRARGGVRGYSVGQTPTRGARRPYEVEEVCFIWYAKIDLRQPWETVIREFARQFPARQRSRGGLQCRFYRALTEHGVDKIREQAKQMSTVTMTDENRLDKFGVIKRTTGRYPWMQPRHQKEDVLPELRNISLSDLDS